jgi:hypothetical protein
VSPALLSRLEQLQDEGHELWRRFDVEVRQQTWHPFVPADYGKVLPTLIELRATGASFLEWGSGNGVITIMADLLGYEACGIELDSGLVDEARSLAARFRSGARFAEGSFLPAGYEYRDPTGDRRTGTIGVGQSGYLELGRPLEDFDLVYGYPWGGEESVMHDVMKKYGGREARLLMHGSTGIQIYRNGRREG